MTIDAGICDPDPLIKTTPLCVARSETLNASAELIALTDFTLPVHETYWYNSADAVAGETINPASAIVPAISSAFIFLLLEVDN
jgi:hypothetical protein